MVDPPGYPSKNRRPIVVESEVTPAEFHRQVKARGGITVTIGAGALVAAVSAGLTWFASHGSAQVNDCPSKAQFDALSHQVDELHSGVAALASKVNSDGDRAHNDLELVKLKLDVLARQKP